QAGGRGSGSGSGRYSSSGSKSVGTAMRCSSGMPVGISAPLKLLILAHAPSARTLGTAALESTPAACEGYDFSRRSWLAPYREDLCAGVSKSDTPRGAGGLVSGAASKAVVPLVEASR